MSRMSKKFFGTVSGVASVALASSSLTFANPPKPTVGHNNTSEESSHNIKGIVGEKSNEHKDDNNKQENTISEDKSQSLTNIKGQFFSDNSEKNKIDNENSGNNKHPEGSKVTPEGYNGESSNGGEAAAIVGGIFIAIVLAAACLKSLIAMARYG